MKKVIGRLRLRDDDKAKWDRAADTWRLPYWDWSTERVPKAVRIPELNIITPEIRVEEHIGILENPLHKSTNPSKKPMGDVSMKPYAIDKHEDPDNGTYPV